MPERVRAGAGKGDRGRASPALSDTSDEDAFVVDEEGRGIREDEYGEDMNDALMQDEA